MEISTDIEVNFTSREKSEKLTLPLPPPPFEKYFSYVPVYVIRWLDVFQGL